MESLNSILLSNEIKEQFYNIDTEIIKSCEKEAEVITKTLNPDLIINQSTIDLVIRPLASTIALYEMMLQNLFSFSSLDTLYNSTTLLPSIKTNLLKSIAKSNGIDVFGNDPDTIYNQIKFFIENNSLGNKNGLSSKIFSNINGLSRLFFADILSKEMIRNKISHIQLSSTEQMNFFADGNNVVSLMDGVFSRSDLERFTQFKNSKDIELTGMLDVYFDSGLTYATVVLDKGKDNKYNLGNGYYISIQHKDKNIILLNDDRRKNGIVSSDAYVFIEDGEDKEEVDIIMYTNIDKEVELMQENFVTSDILFKGFYPLFATFKVMSKKNLTNDEKDIVTTSIKEYIYKKRGRIDNISILDISSEIQKNGVHATVSTNIDTILYLQSNFGFDFMSSFPLTMSDINIPNNFKRDDLSINTISLKLKGVLFETE